jgi:hypothetical protein
LKSRLYDLLSLLITFLNKYLFRDKVIIVVLGKGNNQGISVSSRIKFFFSDRHYILFLKERRILNYLLCFLPFSKLFSGLIYQRPSFSEKLLWYNVDPCIVPLDAWVYHGLLSRFNPVDNNECNKIKVSFIKLIESLKKQDLSKSYIFATGPSLQKAFEVKFHDGYRIVCNTIVKDNSLWHYISPHIIVAGDALYHFSDSSFSIAFIKDLRQRLKESPSTVFVYPMLFHRFVVRELTEFADRLYPVPIGDHKDITVDLTKTYALPALGNVLNLLLLPLAINLSKEIYFWGFDGRSPNDKDFWSNSDKHFYNDLVPELKMSHPAFFDHFVPKNNESSYVRTVHGDILELSLNKAEREGWKFNMMHDTYTPALKARYKS